MFRHRQQLRRWAVCMLLSWLFGLGASVANACLATGHEAPSHGPAQVRDAASPSHDDDAHSHPGKPAKANCQDFCGKAKLLIPPLKSALDDVQSHAVIATAAVTVLPRPAFAPVQPWVPRRDGVQAPSIPIEFLRLAL
jgi:hypothetical protein